jgi:hypothetical protein
MRWDVVGAKTDHLLLSATAATAVPSLSDRLSSHLCHY